MSISQPSSYSLPLPASTPAVGPTSAETDEVELIGNSAAIRRLRLQVRRIGPHFRTVLVKGEPGTEKEQVARALNKMTQTPQAPFVACSPTQFETSRNGNIETDLAGSWMTICHGGTLFLDEISEMSLKAQGRLLDVLIEHESGLNRLESSQRLCMRVIASTSEDLRIMVSTGRFRQALYQRLATVEITVPPLRERIDDLDELVRHLIGRFTQQNGKIFSGISDVAMEQMRQYRWPDNLRELERVLWDSVVRSNGGSTDLYPSSVSVELSSPEQSEAASKSVRLQDVVAKHVLRVLKDNGGNKLRAAEALGISRSTLYRILDTGVAAK